MSKKAYGKGKRGFGEVEHDAETETPTKKINLQQVRFLTISSVVLVDTDKSSFYHA